MQEASRLELLAVIICVAAMLAANLATVELYPRAWTDEAMWVDPAINLLRGNGLTSSTEYNSIFGQFWFGNTPLYPGIVFAWAKLTGDGFAGLRSLSIGFIGLAALLLYQYTRRSSELMSTRSRLALVLLPMFGYGITFAYRSARPDALCVFLAVLLLVATTVKPPVLRRSSVIGVSALFPWAGLQLVAYAGIASVLIVLATGRRHIRTLLWVATGLALGGCLLLGFYAAAGHLREFLIATVLSQRIVTGQMAQYVVLGDNRGASHFIPSAILGALIRDPSTLLGLIVAAILLMLPRVRRSPAVASRLVASLTAALLIPLGMHFAGLFSIYYTWMALLPTWFFILAAVDRMDASVHLERSIAYAFLAGSFLVGWPFLVGSAALDSSGRDYGKVREFVSRVVHPGEWVLISPEAYFAVVEAGGVPFLSKYYAVSRLAPEIPQQQQQRFSAIVVEPKEASRSIARLSGQWTEVASLRVPTYKIPGLSWLYYDGESDSYDLVAYRRAY